MIKALIFLFIFFSSIFTTSSYYETYFNWFNISASSWTINYENLYWTWSVPVNDFVKFLWQEWNFLYYLWFDNWVFVLRNCYQGYSINEHKLSCRRQNVQYNNIQLSYSSELDDLIIQRTNTWVIVTPSNNIKIKLWKIWDNNLILYKKSLIDIFIYLTFTLLFIFTLISLTIKFFKWGYK